MPNWCNNHLVIESDNTQGLTIIKELDLFHLKTKEGDEEKPYTGTGLLNYFRRMPFVLEGTVKGSHLPKWQTDNSQWLKDCYGYDNWYDWAVNNWGTKWDVHDISNGYAEILPWATGALWDDQAIRSISNPHTTVNGQIELQFETAWAPPIEALQYWIKNLPVFCNLKCYLSYVEPNMDFCGVYVAHEDKKYHQSEYSNNKDLPNIPTPLADIWVAGELEVEFFEPDDDDNYLQGLDDDTDKDLFSKVKNDGKEEVA